MRSWLVLASLLVWSHAAAHPPPPPDPEPEEHRPLVEWSSWVRFGFGTTHEALTVATKGAGASDEIRSRAVFQAALGLDLSLPLTRRGDVRLGAWGEFRGFSDHPVGGGEVLLTAVPRKLDLFFYEGQGILALRAGGNDQVWTGSLAYGYLAPWNLFGSTRSGDASRYMIGVRLVANVTVDRDDRRLWTATGGVEVEPVGALRYLLGIRSWYR